MIKHVIKTNKKLKDRIRLYSILFFIGILVGILCRLTDFFPYESLWSLPSIATLFGFWIAFTLAIATGITFFLIYRPYLL